MCKPAFVANRDQSAGLGIGDRVHLKGFVSDEIKYQTLSNCDLFTLISLHEGFGVVYLEAMYCGLPVIAADEGGQTDLLIDGETGRLVPIGDERRLAQSLRDLLENVQLAQSIGDYNIGRFRAFSISSQARRYEDVFESVLHTDENVLPLMDDM